MASSVLGPIGDSGRSREGSAPHVKATAADDAAFGQFFDPRPESQKGPDILQLFRTALRRSPLIIGMILLGAALGYGMKTLLKPYYTSTVALLIDPKRPDSFGADSEFANLYVDSAKIASVVAIMQSTILLDRVVESQHLADDPEFGALEPSTIQRVRDFLSSTQAPALDQRQREARAAEALRHSIRITRDGLSYQLEAAATAWTPAKAQALAQAVANAYIADQLADKAAEADRDAAWLTGRLDKVRDQLKASQEAVETTRRRYGLAETDHGPGSTVETQEITELNAQLLKASDQLVAAQARYEQAQQLQRSGGDLNGLPEAVSSKVIQDLRKQEADAKRRLADLQMVYRPSFPGVAHAENDLRTVQGQVANEIGRIVDNLRNDYQTALAQREALKQQLARLTSVEEGAEGSQGRIALREAQRTVEENRSHYDALLTRWRQVEMQRTREDAEVRIISPASMPIAPSSPKTVLLVGGGGVLGMMAGLAIVFLLPMFESRFLTIRDTEQTLEARVLSVVPQLRRRELGSRGRKRLTIIDYASRNPLSRFAESLRGLRVALGISDGGAPRIIQITSALPGEGKSTIASGLAVSAAMAGIRTALIDGDLRYPSVSGLFGLQADDGVVEVIRGNVPLGTVWRKSGHLPLTVIGAGRERRPEPDVFASAKFTNVVAELARTHDLIVLDSPPVLAVSEALMISRLADTTLLVVKWRDTVKEVVAQAVNTLRANNAPLAGVVLNKAELSKIWEHDHAGYSYRNYRRATDRYYLARWS